MKVLILTQYFAPEITAARSRLEPMAEFLAGRGHEVEVICEVPNHPEGIVRPGHGGPLGLGSTRHAAGYTVRHVWVKASPEKTSLNRLASYATYAAMATVAGALARKPDVILATSPPLPAAAAGMALAALHRAPWVMDVRDPWPEAAVALGEISNRRLVGLLERLERRLYASASAVVTVTEPFRADIAAKGNEPGKVEVIPNGTTSMWLRTGDLEVDRSKLGMPADRFILTYAGNVGLAQRMEAAIEAVAELDDDVQLQIVGGGPRLEKVKVLAAGLPEGRVRFRGLVQPEIAARYLRASDACLVLLDDGPAFEKFVPSKLFDCCAVGRPVILAAGGESLRIASEANAALTIPAGDPAALATAIRRLRDDPALRDRLAAQGRELAGRYLRERQIDRLESLLEDVSHRGRP